jgi:hypothetical protein
MSYQQPSGQERPGRLARISGPLTAYFVVLVSALVVMLGVTFTPAVSAHSQPAPASTPAAVMTPGLQRAVYAAQVLETYGLTPQQAAGVAGNFMQETGAQPATVQNDDFFGDNRGIVLWSPTSKGWELVEQQAIQLKLPADNMNVQLAGLWQDLSQNQPLVLTELRRANNVTEAVATFVYGYLKPGFNAAAFNQRVVYADAVLRWLSH